MSVTPIKSFNEQAIAVAAKSHLPGVKRCGITAITEVVDRATLEELHEAIRPFYMKMPYSNKKELHAKKWASRWLSVIDLGFGKVFGLFHNGKIIGGLGCVCAPALEDGVMVASEAFWYVDEGKRGEGLRLLTHFEQWAKSAGIERVIMVHLQTSMPEKLKALYKKRGYRKAETNYVKEVA